MNFKQLSYFVAIYEQGTLSGAGETARVAVSALSHHLANLEAELGVPLFSRHRRGLEPTASGERLYNHARIILRALEDAQRDLQDTSAHVMGELVIGMAYSAVRAIGLPLMQRTMAEFPKLKLSLSEGLSSASLDHLLRLEVDLAVVFNPPREAGLNITPLLEERLVCVGLRDLIGDTDEPIHFEEMLKRPLIFLRQGASARALLDNPVLLKRLEAEAKFQMNSVQAITQALLAGLGCMVGTSFIVRDEIDRGELHVRPIIEPELWRTLAICEIANRPPTFSQEKIRELVTELIGEQVSSGAWTGTVAIER